MLRVFLKIFYHTVIGKSTSVNVVNSIFNCIISDKKMKLMLTFHIIMDII